MTKYHFRMNFNKTNYVMILKIHLIVKKSHQELIVIQQHHLSNQLPRV
jgi:hypothetical protein